MTGPIPHEGEADDDVQGWMSEAGDPLVEPRPEHVEHLRAMILDQLAHAHPARAKFHSLRWLAAAVVLAATALGLLSLPGRRAHAWAQIVQTMQEKPWVHIAGRNPNGSSDECWISPRNQIMAFTYDHGPTEHAVEYHDLKTAIYFKYIPEERTIYRLPERGSFKENGTNQIALMRKLIRGEIAIGPLPMTEATGPTIREIVEDGKTWIAYEWRLRALGRVKDSATKTRILVDPKTKLPRFWDVESVEGATRRREFDYPDSGPTDILAMSVPADAKRVDRVPGDDLDRLLNGLAIGRNRFDDYQGFAWESGRPSALRVFRKGRKWRVEKAIPKVISNGMPGPPAAADVDWWHEHERNYVFELQAVCDGRSVWYYRYPSRALIGSVLRVHAPETLVRNVT